MIGLSPKMAHLTRIGIIDTLPYYSGSTKLLQCRPNWKFPILGRSRENTALNGAAPF
jgi:hypothetical protein